MTITKRRTKLKAGLVIAMAAIFLFAVLTISLSLSGGMVSNAETTTFGERGNYVLIGSGSASGFAAYSASDMALYKPTDGVIRTKEDLCYVCFCENATGEYTLGANFRIMDYTWAYSNPTLRGKLDGNGYEIWNSSTIPQNTSYGASSDNIGGLFSKINASKEVKNLYYYFSGGMYGKKSSSGTFLAVGGMVAENAGKITNCKVDIAGSIESEGDSEGVKSYIGGFVGYCTGGEINGCDIISSTSITAYTDKQSGSSNAKHNILYAGGVVGKMQSGTFTQSKIKSQAAVLAADNTSQWEDDSIGGQIGSAIGGVIGVDTSTAYNDKEHIHPAGVVLGGLGGGGKLTYCEVEASGSAISYGMAGSSNGGSIAGGLLGELSEDASGDKLVSNAVKLKCSLSAFMVETFNVAATISEWFSKRDKKIYIGGVIGKCNADSGNIKNNYFAIEKDNGIIEDGADFDSDAGYKCEIGLFCGNASGVNRIGANNWMSRKLSECDTGRIAGNQAQPGCALHHLIIFGDGEVRIKGGKITQAEAMTVEAKPICSPFYGWTDQISLPEPTFTTRRENSLNNGLGKAYYAVFIDTAISSAGELTQLAKDINQIELYVFKHIGSANTKDDLGDEKMYFSGASAPTLSWLNVQLTDNILVRDGTPVIEEFYGKFNGNNNTISFAAGSKIQHDFEKDADNEDKDKDDDNDIADYNEYLTGLFGSIKPGAIVRDLKILFGGAIDANNGLGYRELKDSGDLMREQKYYRTDGSTDPSLRVSGRVYDISGSNAFVLPTFEDFNSVHFYGIKGEGYVASRKNNPGYVEVVPYKVDVVVTDAYVGILAGKNEGTIQNVEVEATKSAYVQASALNVYFGTLCGYNSGLVENAKCTMNGKIILRARALGAFGGMFGTLAGSSTSLYNGLNAQVGGEVTIKRALNYHQVSVTMFSSAQFVEGSDTPEGYSQIAYDYTQPQQGAMTIVDSLNVKGQMATDSYRVYDADTTVINELIGTLVGYYQASNVTIANTAAVSGAKGTFNTKIYNVDSTASKIGAVVGSMSGSIPTFQNTWAVMSYEEYEKEADERRLPVASVSYTTLTGVNIVYVQKTVPIAEVDINTTLPVSFTLASQEGMTFSGWYDYTSGERHVITQGLNANVFTPQDQLQSNRVYVAELLNLQLFTEAELKKLSASTNEGRGYLDVEFTLGTNIPVSNFTPIGTVDAPFRGTLNGNGLTITVNSNEAGNAYAGLFGSVGAEGEIKNIVVRVNGDIGSASTDYAGALVAVNYGTIGQDTSTGKVIVEIAGSIKAKCVGGIAGVNHNVIKNAEVKFLYTSETDYGQIEAVGDATTVYAGGAVGFNQNANQAAIVKNIIVYYDNTVDNTPISSKKANYAVGGVLGANDNGAAAYSLVSVCNYVTIFGEDFPGSSGKSNKFRGLILGNNLSKDNTDSLWALCLSKSLTSSVEYDPELGAPIKVYQGAEDDVTTGEAVLMNGEDHDTANILIKYGWGDVTVTISGAESAKGGEITFFSSKLSRKNSLGAETVPEEKRVSFYDYVADFEKGDRVPVSEGNTGYAFSPTVGGANTVGLTGKVYYAGFCNTTIAGLADYKAVAANIANGYRLYAEYNVTNSFVIDETVTASIGSEAAPFIGAINGNANTVTMNSSSSLKAFVGVLGESGDENYASLIKNLRLEVRSGSYMLESEEDKARGFLTDVNNGRISGVILTVHGYLKNMGGSAGAVAGVNYGKIESATVKVEYAKAFGVDGFGAIVAKYAGGVVGENYGELGNSMPNSIDVTVKKDTSYRGVIYGVQAAGGAIGVNRAGGVIRSAIVSFSGTIVGSYASALIGQNEGMVESALISVERGAIYAGYEAFGMVAGANDGLIGIEQDGLPGANFTKVIKSYVYASPYYGASIDVAIGTTPIVAIPALSTKSVGGIVGVNNADGVATAMIVELHSSLIALNNAGVIAGQNAGVIASATITSSEGAAVVADVAGGLIGLNSGLLDRVTAVLRGAVGSATAGENGVVATSFAGGVFGKNTHSGESSSNVAVALYDDVYGETKGLAAGQTTANSGVNSWVQICNSSLTGVIGNDEVESGFNVIRVLNETLLNMDLVERTGRFTFASAISGVKKWYTDISAWTANSGFVSKLTGKSKYDADGLETNVTYYVCYDSLEVLNRTDFNSLATKINSCSYYNNVLFRLGGDIMIANGTVLRPIGTAEYPFNGIFDGAFYSITMQTGSALSGTEYAGLFGYTALNSVIKNFTFTVEEGVSIGSVNSYEIGSLVGYNQGVIKNVFVNLAVNLTYNSQKRYAGELIGKQAAAAPQVQNVWISVLNGKDPVVGNMTSTSQFGVNYLGVLGNGMTEVTVQGDLSAIRANYLLGDEVEISVKYAVPTGENGTASYRARCQAYFDAFGGWYKNIREENSLIKVSYVTGLGDFSSNPAEKAVWLITQSGAVDQNVTLSFINLTIRSEREFIDFAQNIKNYGDQGAVFKLDADITVDFNNCLSVGTPERPFTGTFDGRGHVLTVIGKLIKREYAGVFGYIGAGGTVKNLLIEVGDNVKFGDNDALYSGVAAALLYGKLQSVVVRVHADTVVYTTQGRASSGGIVGRAGKINDNGSVAYDYTIDNCWLIVEENATVTDSMGWEDGAIYDSFYDAHGIGRKMQMVGAVDLEDDPYETNPFKKGALKVSIDNEGNILFDATDGGTGFYGFIDNMTTDEAKMKPISNALSNIYRWTVKPGDLYKDAQTNLDKPTSTYMLCVLINKYITTVQEFLQISENVKLGRNYRGIIYELGADITITAEDLEGGVYSPIGGEVKIESGNGYESFIERDFIGGFYGNGHVITLEAGIVIDARYAGLFGRVGAEARIKGFILDMQCEVGRDNAENTVRTIYAGALAAYATGGAYNDIVIVLDKNATLFGSVGSGRAFGYLPKDLSSDVAANCWVINYNSKANYEMNENEIAFNNGGDGNNQGGVNSLMVIAAGIVSVNITPVTDGYKFYFTYTDPNASGEGEQNNPYWTDRYTDEALGEYFHTTTDYVGDGWNTETFKNNGFFPTRAETRRIYNVSFLKAEISSYEDLQKYATNVNEGYDFYKLTFTLEADIEIEEDFVAIGNALNGLNGTFDGKKHTITLPKNVTIEGRYAGIFGLVSEDGEIKNLRIVLAGQIGKNSYTQQQIDTYHVENTLYAGAIAYNKGKLSNVIVVSEGVALKTLYGFSGLVIAYDETNLSENVWALVDASSYVDAIGVCAVGDTRVNTMTVIGIGVISATFKEDNYQVKFTTIDNPATEASDKIAVMGWYKSFEKNQQISKAMLSSGDLMNGEDGYLVAPTDHVGVKYEVAVIKTTITSVAEMIAVAEDVNVGGYTFENITFNLGADLSVPDAGTVQGYVPIGTDAHHFKGTFSGKDGNDYHKITLIVGQTIEGLFGYNAGLITDLQVEVKGTVGKIGANSDNIYGVVACVNRGTIKRVYVEIAEGGLVTGYTVGGIAGNNLSLITDCVVRVSEGGAIEAKTSHRNVINAGAVAGINYGTIEGASDFTYWSDRNLLPTEETRIARFGDKAEANVFIFGTVSAVSTAAEGSGAATNAGGAVGNQNDGYLNYMIVYVAPTGTVKSVSPDAGLARAGGFVGYAKAAMNHNVTFLYGTLVSEDLVGGTAGYLDGVIALNVWQVTLNCIVDGAGEGAKTVNSLNIKGNGKVKAAIDLFTKRINFINVTEAGGSTIDGWYTAASVEVDDNTGNVGGNGNSFLPLGTIQNKYVMVIFVNTEIRSAADLNDMASSVSGGLSGNTIEFTLMNDIDLYEGDLTALIGTVEYPFNNTFNGQGFKITLHDGALFGDEYMALFGYTGSTAVIRDLVVVVEEGTYGRANAERTAVLVAYNEGTITDVTLTLSEGAELLGGSVGVVATTSFGTIQNITLTLNGRLTATSSNTAIAGGLVGASEGPVDNITITAGESFEAVAGGMTAYAGVLAGENYKVISRVNITYQGTLTANGSKSGYAGVVVGENLGNVNRAYVIISGGRFGAGISGGIIGNNVNALTTSLVKIVGEDFVGTDSAVGYAKSKDATKVHNVWVYSDKVNNISAANCVNSMTFEEHRAVSCPTAEEVMLGKISFGADISDVHTMVAYFAVVTDGVCDVGTGAAMDNVVYQKVSEQSTITYLTYDMVLGEAVSRQITDVRVRFVTRKGIGSGSELFAFAQAVNSGVYTFDSAEFYLTNNVTLPERAFPAITLPATATFDGRHYVITVGDAILADGLFESNAGTIKRTGLRLTKEEDYGFVKNSNEGVLSNLVVYLENGADVVGYNYFAGTNNGDYENLWIVTRNNTVLDRGAFAYCLIKINGVGTLLQGGGNGLTFTASQDGDIIFIGYTNQNAIFSENAVFDTTDKIRTAYTAEFISKTLDTDYKLKVLSDVTALGYQGENETFTVAADLVVTSPLFTMVDNPFLGTIEGNGFRVKAQGVTTALFGNFGGAINNLIIDLTEGGTLKLFNSDETVRLTNVVLLEERDALSIGATVTASDVWVVTQNETLYNSFVSGSASAYSLLYKNGDVRFAFADGITVTAEDDDDRVFAGWYGKRGSVFGTVNRTKSLLLASAGGNVYLLNYINRTFTCEDDIVRLGTAVNGGFDFEGVTFYVQDGGFEINNTVSTIGDATHEFKGNIYGGVKSSIVYRNPNPGQSITVNPFLNCVVGTIKELIFVYDEDAVFAGTPTLVNSNLGAMNSIVVVSQKDSLFTGGAGLTLVNGGEIKNSWFITKGTERAVLSGSNEGVNEMRVDDSGVDIGFDTMGAQGTRVNIELNALTKTFLCLYDFDGKVVFPGNYNSGSGIYTSPATASGNKIAVRSVSEISDQDEFVYLGYLTATGNLAAGSKIKLKNDVQIKRNLKTIRFDNLTLDLNGHYLDLVASSATAETIFGNAGTIKNGSIYLHKGCYAIGGAGLGIENAVIFLTADEMTLPSYKVTDVKVVTEDRTRVTELSAQTGSYAFVYAPKAAYSFNESPFEEAAFYATFVGENFDLEFVGQENENIAFYYGGMDDVGVDQQAAYFAAKMITTAEEYENFVLAAYVNANHLQGAVITLGKDVVADGEIGALLFKGTLLGGGHTVTVQGGTFPSAYLTVYEGGSVSDIAFAFKGATVTAENLVSLPMDCEGRVVVVVYQTTSAKQEETQATAVNVYGTGDVNITFDTSAISLTAIESGNYALREWKDASGNTLGNQKTVAIQGAVTAHFAVRYLLTVEYEGITEEVKNNNESDLPTFTGIGVIFEEDVVAGKVTVEVADIGKNFLFTGLTSDDATVAMGENAWTYSVTFGASYEVVLKAQLNYIRIKWQTVEYKASETRFTEYDDLKASLSTTYDVEYEYTPLDSSVPLVSSKPYHAGSYLVSFRIYTKVNRVKVCDAVGGLIIEKAILKFDSVAVADKYYDGTADAEKVGEVELSGFKGTDKNFVTIDGLKFSFADENAGKGKLVYVSGDATLGYKAAAGATETDKYVYRNYDFDAGSVTSGDQIIRADINLRPLILSVEESVEVEYLAQFDGSAPSLTPTIVSGLVEKDRAAFESAAAALVTRENADCYDVGYYRIIVGNSFAFPNYEVRLTPGSEAFYIISPSEVLIEFDDDDVMVYGEKNHTPKYHVFVGESDHKTYRALREGDVLYFSDVVYNGGNEMLPGESKYSFTCLFSAQNTNYTAKVANANDYRIVNGKPLAVLRGSNTLTVNPKPLTVTSDDTRNTKRFGKRSGAPVAELTAGNSFVEKDATLVVTRAAGEAVGTYALSYAVKDKDGADITSRYTISTQTGEPYYYEITPVAIRIKPTKTSLIYGDSVQMIKYGVSVEGGGITIADLYFATTGREKSDATLSDIGITVALSDDLKAALSVGEYDANFVVSKNNDNISEVRISGAQRMIIVQKRYLNLVIDDIAKKYDGTNEVKAALFGYQIDTTDPSSGLLAADKRNVRIIENGYRVLGNGTSVGVYKIDGDFALEGSAADNYYLTYVQGNLTINPVAVSVTADIGYFDEEGAFVPAKITRNGSEYSEKIYYGDSKATFNYSLDKDVPFLNVPDEGTDQEISEYIANALKISHYRLNGLVPDFYEAADAGMVSANNNFTVTFSVSFDVEPVRLTIKLLPMTKTIGQPDPEFKYEIVATDAASGETIEGYDEIAKGTFDVIITADRSDGEKLGTYDFQNIKVDILNLAVGESLTDEESTTGEALGSNVELETKDASLKIKQKAFIRTTIGKLVVYGLPILVIAGLAVFLIIYIPRARRKKRAKMYETPHRPDDGGTSGGAGGATPIDATAEGGEEAPAPEEPAADSAVADSPAAETPEAPATSEPVADDSLFSDAPVTEEPVTAPTETAAPAPTTEDPSVDEMFSSEPPTTGEGDYDASDFDIGSHDEH